MREERRELPIDAHLPEILRALRERGALVLVSPPGSGKTTRVPPALLDELRDARGGADRVLLVEPRRVAARAAAERIADERGGSVGEEIGYSVRFERRVSDRTRLEVLTPGVLLRRLQRDPFLDGVAAVLFDEVHERGLETDLAIAFVREARGGGREDLLVAALSATVAPARLLSFLGDDARGDASLFEAPGRPYPVEIAYRPVSRHERIERSVAEALRVAWRDGEDGHSLVFLPGLGEIRAVSREIASFARSRDLDVWPLHGRLPLREQSRAIAPSRRRKILLATNVAETSITVEGVDLVVDSGLERRMKLDLRLGLDRLETLRVSRASADQRAGRAGRTRPGRALRLWSVAEQATLPAEHEPEVRRVDLSRALLEILAWGAPDPLAFAWLEPPDPAAIDRARFLLESLGAVDVAGRLSSRGRRLLACPLHPRAAALAVEASTRGVLGDGALLAALIEEPVRRSEGDSGDTRGDLVTRSDLLLELDRVRRATRSFDPASVGETGRESAELRRLVRTAREIERAVDSGRTPERRAPRDARDRERALLAAILAAFPDRVVRRRSGDEGRGVMVGGRGVRLAPTSSVREETLFVAVEIQENERGDRREALVRRASGIDRELLEEVAPGVVREERTLSFDEKTEKVRAHRAISYRGLALETPRETAVTPAEAHALLVAMLRRDAEKLLAGDEAASRWLLRWRFLAEAMPELALDPFDPERLGEVLADAAHGARSIGEIRQRGLRALLEASVGYERSRLLERHAPETLELPSGSRVRLVWEEGQAPALAARLQELFGWRETPRIAGGRVPLVLRLLGPNFREVQVTQDLESFWNETYHVVRKDLRARYPKHAWPEDPWTAQAVRGPRRRRS